MQDLCRSADTNLQSEKLLFTLAPAEKSMSLEFLFSKNALRHNLYIKMKPNLSGYNNQHAACAGDAVMPLTAESFIVVVVCTKVRIL